MHNCRVVLADDNDMLREMVREYLETGNGVDVVGEAGDGIALLGLLHSMDVLPHMIIVDVSMPRIKGIEATREVRKRFPSVRVLVMTSHREMEYVSKAFAAGAAGYLLKEDAPSELFDAIGAIHNGERYTSQSLDRDEMTGYPVGCPVQPRAVPWSPGPLRWTPPPDHPRI